MKATYSLLQGYENSRMIRYEEIGPDFPGTVPYDQLGSSTMNGVLKANQVVDGKLMQTYSRSFSHILTIAATRMGKTTSCVIPQILSFARQATKCRMVISDPKGELYRLLSAFLREQGYDVLLLNLRDYTHSELWNPLTPIFKTYQRANRLYDEVELLETPNGYRNRFQGVIYERQKPLDQALEQLKTLLLADVDSEIDRLMFSIIPPDKASDQYWNDAARQWGKALMWAMLEDSSEDCGRTVITEDTFSFNTMFTIADSLTAGEGYDDSRFFSGRGNESRANNYARGVINNASSTRQCVVSCFNAKMQAYRNSAIRLLTSCSSFKMSRLTGEKPVAIFICYPDETKVYYQVISAFVQDAYTHLIKQANERLDGRLEFPVFFMLDEFGNFPKITDFDTVISACGSRNIWFDLVLQSYAQLNNVYGKETAEIIRDNLNIHMFLGSNNPMTLGQFSDECGKRTRLSPKSALNGDKDQIEHYELETVPLVPVSMLANLQPGECIVSEASCGYILFSKMERYYLCEEFKELPLSSEKEYFGSVNPFDGKYTYSLKPRKNRNDLW